MKKVKKYIQYIIQFLFLLTVNINLVSLLPLNRIFGSDNLVNIFLLIEASITSYAVIFFFEKNYKRII